MGADTKGKMLTQILEYDAALTKKFVTTLLQYTSFKSFQVHCKYLEWSCNGIVWLSSWMAFIWLMDNKGLYQMQLNMLLGLVVDIFIIAILKAGFRRRRPSVCSDMLTLGPDKFSFPSGHASRAMFVLLFFIILCPVSSIWWLPLTAWASSVCLSRILLNRHFILDVIGGIVVGVFEILLLKLLWMSEDTALYVINFISNDYLPGGVE